jgi:predicted dehydrogenase
VCDTVADRARSLAADFGAGEVFTDYADALARTSAPLVYLATPVFLHAGQTEAALVAGKHVLVEKPLGINATEAGGAVAAANARSHLRAGCAYFRRFSPRFEHLRQALHDGRLGRIVLVRMAYWSWFNPDPSDPKYWRVVVSKGGGGPLSDMGSHMFDVLIGLMGLPLSVCAKVATLVHPYEADDSSVMLMQMPGGAQVTASFHWNSKTWSHEFEVVGTEGRIKWHPYDGSNVIETIGRETREIDMPDHANVHQPLVEDFVEAVRQGRQPRVTLPDAVKTNVLLDAIYQSAHQAREVTL